MWSMCVGAFDKSLESFGLDNFGLLLAGRVFYIYDHQCMLLVYLAITRHVGLVAGIRWSRIDNLSGRIHHL